eukprot:scaffold81015_cov17-Tisochrysis_lutea.AAC.2
MRIPGELKQLFCRVCFLLNLSSFLRPAQAWQTQVSAMWTSMFAHQCSSQVLSGISSVKYVGRHHKPTCQGRRPRSL